jgi:hypothetical protein
MNISLQNIVKERSAGVRELEFLRHSLCYLSMMSRNLSLESWMITSFDVEVGREIGSGG